MPAGRGPGPEPTPSFSRKNARVWSSAARVGVPSWSTRCSVSTECAFFGCPWGFPAAESISTAMKCVAQLAPQRLEALGEAEGVLAEAQAEHAGTRSGALFDPGQVGVGDPDVCLVPLREGNGSEGWLSTGARTMSSTIIARAKPPVKHIPTTPTPGPPQRSCSAAANLRSHTVTGLVLLSAKAENSRETQAGPMEVSA